jgi:hypothetical protein
VPVKRVDGRVLIEIPAAVAVRLRDDADLVVGASLGDKPSLSWRLTGSQAEPVNTAQEVRAAAAEVESLEISVAKVLSEPQRSDRHARVAVDGAGLVVPLTVEEAQVLADDAARRVLVQLKGAGVRGRVRVEFEIEVDGQKTRDSRPGAVRKLARGEPVGASPSGASGGGGRGRAHDAAATANRALRRRTGRPRASVEAVQDAAEPA